MLLIIIVLIPKEKNGKYVLLTSLDESQELNIWKFYNVIRTIEETFHVLKTLNSAKLNRSYISGNMVKLVKSNIKNVRKFVSLLVF